MSKSKKPPEMPYAGTDIDPYTTQGEISRLLENYNAENIQWTGLFKDNNVNLKFILKTKEGKLFAVELIPPDIRIKRRTWSLDQGKYVKVLVPAWPQSMRLLYWYIEAKLKAITWNLVASEREWLSDIVTSLPDGTTRRVGDMIARRVIDGKFALESKPTNTPKEEHIVDVEFTHTTEKET